jgi:hypothetical protein
LKDLENMSMKIKKMVREMQMGFQHAEQRLSSVTEKVGTLADSVNSVTALVHNNTLVLLNQHEERMKRNLLGQLELSIVHTNVALMHTSDPTKQAKLCEKLDSLEQKQDSVRDECDNMSSTIGNLLISPPQISSAPLQAPAAPPKHATAPAPNPISK